MNNLVSEDVMNQIIAFLTEVSKWIYIVLFLIVFFVILGLIIAAIVNIKRFKKYKKEEGDK